MAIRYSFTCSIQSNSKTIELHATGCRDLATLRTAKRELVADSYLDVVGPAHDAGIKLVALPCCAPKRMAAAGRVILVPDAPTTTTTEAEVVAAEPVAEPTTTEAEVVAA